MQICKVNNKNHTGTTLQSLNEQTWNNGTKLLNGWMVLWHICKYDVIFVCDINDHHISWCKQSMFCFGNIDLNCFFKTAIG